MRPSKPMDRSRRENTSSPANSHSPNDAVRFRSRLGLSTVLEFFDAPLHHNGAAVHFIVALKGPQAHFLRRLAELFDFGLIFLILPQAFLVALFFLYRVKL